jgi:hypothetical protein
MIAQLLKTTLLALPVAGLLALAPVAFADDDEDYDDESPHARMHDSLEVQHEATHDELEAQHETAHQYPMTARQHRALHRALEQEHRAAHHDLRDQHEDYHDQDYEDQDYYGEGRSYDAGECL